MATVKILWFGDARDDIESIDSILSPLLSKKYRFVSAKLCDDPTLYSKALCRKLTVLLKDDLDIERSDLPPFGVISEGAWSGLTTDMLSGSSNLLASLERETEWDKKFLEILNQTPPDCLITSVLLHVEKIFIPNDTSFFCGKKRS